jgi:hypothetical protein
LNVSGSEKLARGSIEWVLDKSIEAKSASAP